MKSKSGHHRKHTPPASAPEPAATVSGLERFVFFSDAVFAIAITLLALDIRLPGEAGPLTNSELAAALLQITPKYLGYVISFLVIGSFWVAHHRKFSFVQRTDQALLWLNLLMLMFVAFIPFPTAVLSASGNRAATIFYALTMVVVGLLAAAEWAYATRNNRLVSPDLDAATARRILLRSLAVPFVFALSIGLAYADADLARYSWLLIAPVTLILR